MADSRYGHGRSTPEHSRQHPDEVRMPTPSVETQARREMIERNALANDPRFGTAVKQAVSDAGIHTLAFDGKQK